MPKYKYRCNVCHEEWNAWHQIDEDSPACSCGERSKLQRLPPIFTRTKTQHTEKKVGDITTDHIEEARRDLKAQKVEATKEELD